MGCPQQGVQVCDDLIGGARSPYGVAAAGPAGLPEGAGSVVGAHAGVASNGGQYRGFLSDEPNLVSAAGLVPVLGLAEAVGLQRLAQQHLSVPTDKGANAGLKVASLVAGMVAGADSIDDMALLRHGGMGRVFASAYAPSTLGSFLRTFTFGHVRQLDAVCGRFLAALAVRAPIVPAAPAGLVLIDVDDTIVEVHGYAKQGAGFGYSKVRGLNALLATVSTPAAAPVIVAQRLRRGSCGSPRGAKRLVADAAAQVRRLLPGRPPLLRADSAFFGRGPVGAAVRGGCQVSITVRQDATVKAAIAQIGETAWIPIDYPDAVFDEPSGRWISRAEVAEIGFTAFAAGKRAEQIPGRLVVRRIPELNPTGQDGLFDLWRFHAFFTTSGLDTVTADRARFAEAPNVGAVTVTGLEQHGGRALATTFQIEPATTLDPDQTGEVVPRGTDSLRVRRLRSGGDGCRCCRWG